MKKDGSLKLIFGYLGIFLIFVGIMCLVPLLVLINPRYYAADHQYWLNFFIPGISSILLGGGLSLLLLKAKKAKLGKHQDSVLLVLIWICAIIICSIPFLLKENLNFTESIFETTSGFSTIGLTVFTDFIGSDNPSYIYMLWRGILTLIGGVGLVLVLTTAISDKYNLNLYSAEGHNDKLLPNLRKSAVLIFGIYVGLILFGTFAYAIVFYASKANTGDELFEAFIHSISAVATGGFSSRSGGLVEIFNVYGSKTIIEIISVILMLAGSVNFLTHMFLLTGQFKKAWKDCEIRLLLAFLLIFIPVFSLVSFVGNTANLNFGQSFSSGAFTFISAISTTGFSNVSDIRLLGQGVMFLVVFVNIIGGGAGSTAGGVKQYRVAVAAKSFYWGTKARLSSSRIYYPHFVSRLGEDREIKRADEVEAFGYIALYSVIMFIGGLFVTVFAKGCSFGEGLFEFSNAISSTGLSNGLTLSAAHHGDLMNCNFGVLWTLILGMLAGRLEILPIYFAGYRVVRDILGKETV